MGKVLLSIVGLILLLILGGTVLPDVVDDTASDPYAENYNVATGVGVTSTVQTLTYEHYYEDLRNLASTSDNGNDTPVVMAYDEDTYEVTVSGLEASASRLLTIDYYREANQQFTGFSAFLQLTPFLFIIGGIIACLWGLFSSFKRQ